jgi:hypothetical protein
VDKPPGVAIPARLARIPAATLSAPRPGSSEWGRRPRHDESKRGTRRGKSGCRHVSHWKLYSCGGRTAGLVDGWRLDVLPGDLPDDLLIDALRREAALPGAGREVFLAMEIASDWPRSIDRNYVKLLRDTHVTG